MLARVSILWGRAHDMPLTRCLTRLANFRMYCMVKCTNVVSVLRGHSKMSRAHAQSHRPTRSQASRTACSGRKREKVRGTVLLPCHWYLWIPSSFPAPGELDIVCDLNDNELITPFHAIPTLPTALLSFVYFHTCGNNHQGLSIYCNINS